METFRTGQPNEEERKVPLVARENFPSCRHCGNGWDLNLAGKLIQLLSEENKMAPRGC
jgi:hypothetical protein